MGESAGGDAVASSNEALATALSQWVLKEHGVLRVGEVKHHLDGEADAPAAYTIMQNVIYSIQIEELTKDGWAPFKAKDISWRPSNCRTSTAFISSKSITTESDLPNSII